MIDVEKKVFKIVRDGIKMEYPNIRVYSEYTRTPKVFPCIMVEEIDTQTYLKSQDTNSVENHIIVSYQVDIYDDGENKKSSVKAIASTINDLFIGLKFSRVFGNKISNEDDDNIYRYTMRFTAVIGSDDYVYSI